MWVSTERSYRLIQTPFKSANKRINNHPENGQVCYPQLYPLPIILLDEFQKEDSC